MSKAETERIVLQVQKCPSGALSILDDKQSNQDFGL